MNRNASRSNARSPLGPGTSLTVGPANQIALETPPGCLRLVVNRERVGDSEGGGVLGLLGGGLDYSSKSVMFAQGDCDQVFLELTRRLGWAQALDDDVGQVLAWASPHRCVCCPRVGTRKMRLVEETARLRADALTKEINEIGAKTANTLPSKPASKNKAEQRDGKDEGDEDESVMVTYVAPKIAQQQISQPTGFLYDPIMEKVKIDTALHVRWRAFVKRTFSKC